jgi:hypothetical protein
MLVGVLFLLFLREVPDAPTLDATSLLDRIKGIPRIIREDATIRRLILIQLLLSCYSLSTPFYSLFAVTQLGVDDGLIGHFLVYQTAGRSHAANAEGTTLILPVMFFLYGASISGTFLGFNNYVMGLSDRRYRPVLLGMMNALYIVTSILPVLGGIIVEFLPYELLFLTSIVPVGGSLLLTHGLRQKLE